MTSIAKYQFIGLLFCVLCFSYVLNTSIFKEGGARHLDGRQIYVAGQCWLSGQSPYDRESYTRMWDEKVAHEPHYSILQREEIGISVYPPTLGILALPSALFPSWDSAKYFLDLVNVLLLIATLSFTALLIGKTLEKSIQINMNPLWFGIGLGCLISAVPATLFLSQPALIALAGCLGALYFAQQGHVVVTSLLILLASIKPQLFILPLTYLFIMWGSWRLLGWSVAWIGGISLGFFILGGDYNPFIVLLKIKSIYESVMVNMTDNVAGLRLRGFLYQENPLSRTLLMLLGLIATVSLAWLYKQRQIGNQVLPLALPFAMTIVFLPNHLLSYNYIILFLLVASLPILNWRTVLLLLPGIILIARPGNLAYLVNALHWGNMTGMMLASLGAVYLMVTLILIIGFESHTPITHPEK